MAGYKLVWKDKPNPYAAGREKDGKSTSFTYSLGFSLDKDGKVAGTLWNSPAFNAGVVTGAQVMAVNGKAYDAETLKTAITAAKARQGAHRAAGQARRPVHDRSDRLPRRAALPVDRTGQRRRAAARPPARAAHWTAATPTGRQRRRQR